MLAHLAHDNMGAFDIRLYFSVRYGINPSKAAVYLDVPEVKENFDIALNELDTTTYDLREHTARWTMSKNVNDDPDEDYTYFLTLAATATPLCAELELNNDEVSLIFYYDRTNAELEAWVLDQLRSFRRLYGQIKLPEIRLLARTSKGFSTTRLKIKRQPITVAEYYNDDFKAVDERIRAAIDEERSGLIMLYGLPGTGKTTYVKWLVQEHPTTKFIFVPNDVVKELLHPSFIAFIVKQRNTVLVIEDAEKVIASRRSGQEGSVVSTLLQLTDGLFSDYLNLKVICTFNTDPSRIDDALFRKGRLIAAYEFRELTAPKVAALTGDDLSSTQPTTLSEIFNEKEADTVPSPRRIGFRES